METKCPNCGSKMIKAPCDFMTYLAASVGAKALECPRCGHREMKYREVIREKLKKNPEVINNNVMSITKR